MELIEYINQNNLLMETDSMKKCRIAFLSNFTINGLAEVMRVLCNKESVYAKTYVSNYNQYAQEILNKNSKLYSFNADIIFLIIDSEHLLGDFIYFPYRLTKEERENYFKEKFDEFESLLRILKKNTSAKIVVNELLLPVYSDRGILENKESSGLKKSIQKFNEMLHMISKKDFQLFVFNFNDLVLKKGCEFMFDNKMKYLADIRISPKGIVELGKEYMAYIFPLMSLTKKCLVLDLDNTLWGGVVGEDGIEGINLGPEKQGQAFIDFQKRILGLFERGVILAVNSKNNYDDAIEVIKKHKHMILKEENFACIKANWNDKVSNFKEIANELNIGLDSMVFIDDDKTNRELVKEFLPEVMVVDLPEDPSEYPKIIEDLKVFNVFGITQEDLKKGEMYVDQSKRNKLKSQVQDLDSFLKQLKIKATIKKVDKPEKVRASQMTQKTNQFNLTTKRYLEEDIEKFIESKINLIKFIQVEDKFGNYGITGLFIVIKYPEIWEIDSFLLSCRILGKNIEFAFMQNLINEAKKQGIKRIKGVFIPSKKNAPAKNFLKECGFKFEKKEDGGEHYLLNVGNENKKEVFIEVKEC